MTYLAIAVGTVAVVIAGRIAFGQWFNHFSLYGAMWGFSIFMFELRLIEYYPVDSQTWEIIFSGSFAFLVGSATVWALRQATGRIGVGSRAVHPPARLMDVGVQEALTRVLWVLNIVTFLAVLQHWYVTVKLVGGIPQVFILGNLLYSYRVEHGIQGGIPYLKSLALLAALLAGTLTAIREKLKFVAIAPVLIIFLGEIVAMGRLLIIESGVFFLSGYTMTRFWLARRKMRFPVAVSIRRGILILVLLAMVMAGMEFIRGSRRGVGEEFTGSTTALKKFRTSWIISPSMYLYLSAHFGVLDQYLKHGHENVPWGGNSFGPVYHILSKLGSNISIPNYPPFYSTPVYANAGTYLRDLHADYGILGVLIYPYLLGLVTSLVWFRLHENFTYVMLVILGCLLTVVVMSLFVIVLRGGDLFMVAGVGLLVGWYLDTRTQIPAAGRLHG